MIGRFTSPPPPPRHFSSFDAPCPRCGQLTEWRQPPQSLTNSTTQPAVPYGDCCREDRP